MPFINRDFIDNLFEQLDIVAIINKRVPLKKAGKDYKACCPFHHEKTPSFSVSISRQSYHCFGCSEGGGAVNFIMKFDNLDFMEAVKVVASESGIDVVYDEKVTPVNFKIKRYQSLMQQINDFYQQQLRNSLVNNVLIAYAKNRLITKDIARRFQLGFAPPKNSLLSNFGSDKEAIADLQTMGLLVAKEEKYYEHFRNRLMFPIHNAGGKVIAFGGRVLTKDDKPKYLNSPETEIFSKSKELYGLYHCRKYSRRIDYILVVEGYMDVLALHQKGITQVVATLGTATTSWHLNMLARNTNTIIFCFDGDAAGRTAAWRALETSLPIIKGGLVIKFLFLPDGEDPDTLLKKESISIFEKRIQASRTLSMFLFEYIKAEINFNSIEGKTLFLEKVLKFINKVDYNVYKEQLIIGVAKELEQSVEYIRSLLKSNKPLVNDNLSVQTPYLATNFHNTYQKKVTPKNSSLIVEMIKLLLYYPTVVDSLIKSRVEIFLLTDNKDKKTTELENVLLKLINLSQTHENIFKYDLIEFFKDEIVIYKYLQELCAFKLDLNEAEAKSEFLSALDAAEMQKKQVKIKQLFHRENTKEEQIAIIENIKNIQSQKTNK